MYSEEIAALRLEKSLAENARLVKQVRQLDSVLRAACNELDLNYYGVDVSSLDVVTAIQKLRENE